VRESLAEGGVAVSGVVGGRVVGLVRGAAGVRAGDGLAIAGGERGVDVDRCADMGEVPRRALTAVLGAEVGVAVLGEDDTSSDTSVSADHA